MKDIFEKLFYMEMEENPQTIPNRQTPKYLELQACYDTFFETLNEEQKKLYFAYEEVRHECGNEENTNLYRQAFISGFSLAEELYKTKNE